MSGFQMCFMGLLLSTLHLGRKQFLQSMQCPRYNILYSPRSQKKILKCKTIEAMQTRGKKNNAGFSTADTKVSAESFLCYTLLLLNKL